MTTTKIGYRKSLSDLRKKRDKKDWITGPAIVNGT